MSMLCHEVSFSGWNRICYKNFIMSLSQHKHSKEIASALEHFARDLKGSPFEGHEMSVLTHFINSKVTFPHVRDDTFNKVRNVLNKQAPKETFKFTFIDLFAGLGGFRIGLQNHGGKTVFSSEWDKTAQELYFKNHGDFPFGDITNFTNEDVSDNELGALIPGHDLLAGGFPCQPFSRAGVSARSSLGMPHGFECSTQGTLFYSIERIARIKRPKILFLENVKNLISHDGGKTFATIKTTIEQLGYKFFYSLVSSETLVPQRRVRCFIVGVRQDLVDMFGDFEFPSFAGDPIPLKTALDASADASFTISDKLWQGHVARSERNKARGTGFTTGLADLEKPSNTIVARYGKDGKECLIPQKGKNPRMLTIDECKRLFGYSADFKLPAHKTPAYKLLGNSVVVPVIEKIGRALINQYLDSPYSTE